MFPEGENGLAGDDVLNRADALLKKHRAATAAIPADSLAVPTLTEAIDAGADAAAIPTLTDIVASTIAEVPEITEILPVETHSIVDTHRNDTACRPHVRPSSKRRQRRIRAERVSRARANHLSEA